jgi:hypothetical protein
MIGCMLTAASGDAVVAQAVEERWALSPAACSGELFSRADTPLIVTGNAIRWFSFDCTVVSNYKVGQAYFLQATCASEGRRSTIPVMLEPRGERLRVGWNREAIVEMQRCRWTDAWGYHWAVPEPVLQQP